jgi:UDP-glucose 4-epimerase
MRILITGGAGYVGAELVWMLANREEVTEVVVYDNLNRDNVNLFIAHSHKMLGSKVRFVQGDILDTRKLKKAVESADVVYHLAARVSTPFSSVDSHLYEQVNNWGTAELAFAVEEAASVKKLIYLSTTSVYGSSKEEANEATVPNPRTFYSISKFRGEGHISRLAKQKEVYIARVGNIYGYSPAMRFDSVINRFIFDAHFTNRISIHGSGRQTRPFISIHKSCQALVEMALGPIPAGTYNLVDFTLQIMDVVEVLREIYEGMEFLFINQHLELRELNVSRDSAMHHHWQVPVGNIKEDLMAFRNHFSFTPSHK